MAQAARTFTSFDTLGARLSQASGALLAVQNSYDDEHGYILPHNITRDALDAVYELLSQATEAFERLTGGTDGAAVRAALQ